MSALDSEALIFKRLHPHTYLTRFLSSTPSIREDSRSPSSFRPASAVLSTLASAHGSCLVRLGPTSVVAAVTAEVGRPRDEAPEMGRIVPSLDLAPLCSPRFKPGPPGEESQTVVDKIMAVLEASPPIDLSQLCISYGEAVWVLYVDLVCLSYDGNVLDAAMLAICGALLDTKLPAAKWDADAQRVICSSAEPSQRLELQNVPLTCSFGGYKGKHLLADPSAFESALVDSSLVLALSSSSSSSTPKKEKPRLVLLQQAGVCACSVGPEDYEEAEGKRQRAGGQAVELDDEQTLEHALRLATRQYGTLREVLRQAESAREEQGEQ